jgi:hypothetical protein
MVENLIYICKIFLKNKIMKNILYIIIFLLLPAYGFAEKTLQEKVSIILNDKSINEPYENFRIAHDTVIQYFFRLPFEEVMPIYQDVLLPFVEKNVKGNSKYYRAKSIIYEQMGHLYENTMDTKYYPNIKVALTKAIEFAELSGDVKLLANMYDAYAWGQSVYGNIQLSHEYFYKAITIYESLNDYKLIFGCLFNIASDLLHIRDLVGLSKVIEQMQEYIKNPSFDGNPYCYYTLYSVQTAYYNLHTENNPENTTYNDSALVVCRNTIHLIESKKEQLKGVPIAYAYYNISLIYKKSYPDRYDSICYFLDKALTLTSGENLVDIELEICVYILYAELHFEQKKYAQAEKEILYVLSLLEQVKDNNSVATEFTEAYKFLVMFYQTMNRPLEALKYYELLLENEKKRYENEKIVAMNDMLVKYETEKKIEQIDHLTEQNINSQKILTLTVGLITVLFIVLLIIVYVHRLRKKNFEQSIYESALLAELKQNELDAERMRIKQHLEQKPTKTMIEKLIEWIASSAIEKSNKNRYILKLSDLNNDMLEQGFLTADEKISKMDMKYIICFSIDMDVKDMSLLFNVEPASIRTVRYRIKKKFGQKNSFAFLV